MENTFYFKGGRNVNLMTHEYNSADYYAQTFREFFSDYFSKKTGSEITVSHSGNSVLFSLDQKKWSLEFLVGNDVRTRLEVNDSGEWKGLAERKIKIKRTRKGKVAASSYSQIYDFVMNSISWATRAK